MDGEVGDGGVEAAIGERHSAHISVMNADSLRDSLQRCISLAWLHANCRIKLPLRPQIDAHRAAAGQQLLRRQ